MVRHKARTFLTMILFASLAGSPLQAENLSQLLAPCTDQDTLAVIRIDTTDVDVDALFDMIVQTASKAMDAEQVKRLASLAQRTRQTMKEDLAKFRAAGGGTLYAIVSVSDGLLLAIPMNKGAREAALKEWVEATSRKVGSPCTTQIRQGNLLLAGQSWAMERRQAKSPVIRRELDKAAAKATPAAIQVFLIPTVDSRRVLEAMLPAMAGLQLQIPTNALVNGFQWAVKSINPPPRASVNLHVESADAASARALREVLLALWESVGRLPQLKQAYPELATTLTMLTPTVKDDTLQLSLDAKQCTSLASQVLTPGLFQMRESILRIACGEELSGMAKALLIYANDYEDKWPPSLATLVDTVEYPRSGLTCPAMRHKPDYESYVYRGVDTGGTSAEPMIIMVHDRAGNHPGGRNVTFVDSHVEWVTEERFQELIAQDNRLRRGRGLPEKPAK